MLPPHEIQDYLLDVDGTTRDITFRRVRRDRLERFLIQLLSTYSVESASDYEGEDISSALRDRQFARLFESAAGYVHAVLTSDTSLLPRLQVFLDWPVDPGCGVELSFFPDELREGFEIRGFMEMVDEWSVGLGSSDYFVRQENASWTAPRLAGLPVTTRAFSQGCAFRKQCKRE